MKTQIINVRYDYWNCSNHDNMSDACYKVLIADDCCDVYSQLKKVKELCEKECIVDIACNSFIEYTVDNPGTGFNPLDTEGDNIDTLLRVAKSIGYILGYEQFCFDFDFDFDNDL